MVLADQSLRAGESAAMPIETIFAHISCRDIIVSAPWYEKLFGKPPVRRPMGGLVEWQFSDSAEV
jgi:hypothetical protein